MRRIPKKSEAGFGMIEVIIAAGIMSVIGLGFASMMSDASKANRNISQQASATDLRTFASGFLADGDTCKLNFSTRYGTTPIVTAYGNTPIVMTDNIIPKGASVPPAPPLIPVGAGTTIANGALTVTGWSIMNWQSNDNPATPNEREGVAILRLNVIKAGASSIGSQTFIRDVSLVVNLNPAPLNTISTCYSTGAAETFWARGTGANDIFYVGNVGINTSSPASPLDVQGAFPQLTLGSPTAGAGGGLQLRRGDNGAIGTTFGYSTFNDGGILEAMNLEPSGSIRLGMNIAGTKTDVLTVTGAGAPYGRVGIGTDAPQSTLDVNLGMIHAGGSATLVTPANQGAYLNWNGLTATTGETDIINNRGGGSGGFAFVLDAFPGTVVSIPLLINGTGSVGIGTTSPNEKLDVAGNIQISNTAGYGGIHNNNTNGWVGIGGGAGPQVNDLTQGAYIAVEGRNQSLFALNSDVIIAAGRPNGANGGAVIFQSDQGAGAVNNMIIQNTGSVGIGSTSPTQKLEVSGNVAAQAFVYTSDERLKNKGAKLDGLDIVEQLSGYHFTWKADGHADIGVMAQEVERVLPEAVHLGSDGMRSVDYARLVAPLIEAVKEQQKEIKTLQAEVETLKAREDKWEKR